MSMSHFGHLSGTFFKKVWFEQTFNTSLYCDVKVAIDKLLVLVEQLTVGIVSIPITISHLIPIPDFSQSHIDSYMKSVADTLTFLIILLLRNKIKISHILIPAVN